MSKSVKKSSAKKSVSKSVVRPRAVVRTDVDFAVIDGVVRLVSVKGSWNGSMAELQTALRRVVRRKVDGWPSSPRGMRASLDRVISKLRRLGVKSRFSRTPDHARKRVVNFVR